MDNPSSENPQFGISEAETSSEWMSAIETYVQTLDNGLVGHLDDDKTTLFVGRSKTLLVSFGQVESAWSTREADMPQGWKAAEDLGWSYLGLFTTSNHHFIDETTFSYFQALEGKRLFDKFTTVVFLGSKATCAPAISYAPFARNATLLLIQPPEWVFAETQEDAAAVGELGQEQVAAALAATSHRYVAMDPHVHHGVDLLKRSERDGFSLIACWHMGARADTFINAIGMLENILEIAQSGKPASAAFYGELRRNRHQLRPYLRGLLHKTDRRGRQDYGARLCRHVVNTIGGRTFKGWLERYEAGKNA